MDATGSHVSGPEREPTASGLPASIEAAWGVRGRPTRGPRPSLTLDQIVSAAIAVAESDGLAAVSMSRVAAELGSSPMSLYRYVAAKNELLDLMLDRAVPDNPPPLRPGESWRVALGTWARGDRDALMRNPWAVRIPRSGPPVTPNQTRWLESGLASLGNTGLTASEKLSTIILISGFVWNEVLLYHDMYEARRGSGAPGSAGDGLDDMGATYGKAMTFLADPARFPELRALLASAALAGPGDVNAQFEFGLNRILDGLDVLIRSRGSTVDTG